MPLNVNNTGAPAVAAPGVVIAIPTASPTRAVATKTKDFVCNCTASVRKHKRMYPVEPTPKRAPERTDVTGVRLATTKVSRGERRARLWDVVLAAVGSRPYSAEKEFRFVPLIVAVHEQVGEAVRARERYPLDS
jgi:hypothetical protein